MLWEDNYLVHYGIKGQKWGVRRFQNEDGTLTDAGKARLAKKAGEYLPNEMRKLDTTKGQNRRRLAEAYSEDDEKRSYGDSKKKYDLMKTKWASATLKDLGLKDTSAARRDVKAILKDIDPNYSYNKRYPFHDSDTLTETELRAYRERKRKMQHPTREKAKRGVRKIKETVDFMATVKKLIPGG